MYELDRRGLIEQGIDQRQPDHLRFCPRRHMVGQIGAALGQRGIFGVPKLARRFRHLHPRYGPRHRQCLQCALTQQLAIALLEIAAVRQ